MGGLEHSVTIRRKLRPDDCEHLGDEFARRIEQAVTAGFEHPLESAVARQQGALAILHRHVQRQNGPAHGTYSCHARCFRKGARFIERGSGSGRVFP